MMEDLSSEGYSEDSSFELSSFTFFSYAQERLKNLINSIVKIESYISNGRQTFRREDAARYGLFVSDFRALTIITGKRVSNEKLLEETRMYLKKTKYYTELSPEFLKIKSESDGNKAQEIQKIFELQKSEMETGIELAEKYIEELYQIGILDIKVKEIIPFPYETLIQKIKADYELENVGLQEIKT